MKNLLSRAVLLLSRKSDIVFVYHPGLFCVPINQPLFPMKSCSVSPGPCLFMNLRALPESLDGFQLLEFQFPLSWHVACVQICSLKRAGASVKWITGNWQIPKAVWKMSGFWQADCPLKREFHQSWTSLHLRASHNLWDTYMLHFYPQHG